MRLGRVIVVVGALGLGVVGCSGGGDSSTIVTGRPPSSAGAAGGVATSVGTAVGTSVPKAVSGTLSTAGLDKVRFGMTIDEASKAGGAALGGAKTDPSCYIATPEKGPEGVAYTVADGKVERVDVTNPGITTRSGVKVGATKAEVGKVYGAQLQEQARPDGQPGSALVYVPKDAGDAQYRLVFFTDEAAVTAMRAGRMPVVLAKSGCR